MSWRSSIALMALMATLRPDLAEAVKAYYVASTGGCETEADIDEGGSWLTGLTPNADYAVLCTITGGTDTDFDITGTAATTVKLGNGVDLQDCDELKVTSDGGTPGDIIDFTIATKVPDPGKDYILTEGATAPEGIWEESCSDPPDPPSDDPPSDDETSSSPGPTPPPDSTDVIAYYVASASCPKAHDGVSSAGSWLTGLTANEDYTVLCTITGGTDTNFAIKGSAATTVELENGVDLKDCDELKVTSDGGTDGDTINFKIATKVPDVTEDYKLTADGAAPAGKWEPFACSDDSGGGGGDPAVELTKMVWEHEKCTAYGDSHTEVSRVKTTHTTSTTTVVVSCVGGTATEAVKECVGDGEYCDLPWLLSACKGIKVADKEVETVSQTVCWAEGCTAGTGDVTITGTPEPGSTWWKNKSDNTWSLCEKDPSNDFARIQVVEYRNMTCADHSMDEQIVKVHSSTGVDVDVVCLIDNQNEKKQTGCKGDGATECKLTQFSLSECTFGLRAEVSGSTTVQSRSTCWMKGITACPSVNIYEGRPKSGDEWDINWAKSAWINCRKEVVPDFDYVVKMDRVVRIANEGCTPGVGVGDDDDADLPKVDSAIIVSRSDADKYLKIKCTLDDDDNTVMEADYTLKGVKAIVDLVALGIDLKSCVKLGLDVVASATDSTSKYEDLVCFKPDTGDSKCTGTNTFPAVSLRQDQHLDSDPDNNDNDEIWENITGRGCNPQAGGGGTSPPEGSSVRLEASGLGLSVGLMMGMMMN